MKRPVFYILLLVAFGNELAIADSFSLHQAIATAILNNPFQEANSSLVQAARLDASAIRKNSIYPSVTLSSGYTRTKTDVTATPISFSNSPVASISASETIYDGGASKQTANAADWRAKALEAQLNSTDSLVRNTRGQLASTVFQHYRSVASTLVELQLDSDRILLLKTILPYIDFPAGIAQVTNLLSSVQINYDKKQVDLIAAKADFKHVCYIEVPDNLETLEMTDNRMLLDLRPYFLDVSLAISTAKQKNQNYLAYAYQAEETKATESAERARLTRPQVNFVVGDSYSRLKMSGLPGSTTRSPYVGVTVNFPFGGGTRDSLESGKLKVLSAEDNVRAQTDEFTYQITSNISRVISAEPVVAATSANLASLKDQIDRFRANVSSKSKIDKSTLDALIDTLNQFDKTAGDYYNLLGADLSYRYSLEVQIGILFDGVQFGFRNSNSVCANVRPISSPYLCK